MWQIASNLDLNQTITMSFMKDLFLSRRVVLLIATKDVAVLNSSYALRCCL
jgi:hypothetical protein